MSGSEGTGEERTDHPDTTATGLRRRAFVQGAGASVVGLVGLSGVAAGRGRPDGRGEDRGRGRSGERSNSGWWARNESPEIIAHRGFAGLYPENTVGAVRRASRGDGPFGGADGVEIDVVPTAEGDVVVFHDDRLASRDGGERGLTDTEGLVWERDTETVTSAEVLDSGETVPLLTETLAAIPPHVDVNVELKNPGSSDLRFAADLDGSELATQIEVWRPFVESVLGVVDDVANDVLFSSFYEAALAVVREASDYPVAPLLWDSVDDGLAIAREYDADAVHPPYNMIQGTPFYGDEYYTEGSDWADTSILAVADDEGWDVNVYTLATWYEASQLAAAGVDGLIADYPGLLRFVE